MQLIDRSYHQWKINISDAGDSGRSDSNQTHLKGMGTGPFEETQADQKVGYPNKVEAAFKKTHTGNEKGK